MLMDRPKKKKVVEEVKNGDKPVEGSSMLGKKRKQPEVDPVKKKAETKYV